MSSFKKEHDSDSEDEIENNNAVVEEEPEPEEDTSLANSDVVTKYQEAAKIAQAALQEVIAQCVAGARVLDLCTLGDRAIEKKCSEVFRNKVKGKVVEKGVAFPTCVSINEIVCNMSPLASDDQTSAGMVVADGDMVKIDLGVHIDGYISVVAHTLIVGAVANPEAPITGPKANAFHAAWAAARLAAKLITPGKTNADVVAGCNKFISAYGVNAVAGVSMHQLKRYVIDGNKCVVLRNYEENQRVEACTFEANEVYAIDVCVSTGEGKPREGAGRTTVYKRNVDKTYQLKIKSSRQTFNEINKKFPTMPFTLRALEDERAAKMGIRECVQHDLLQPYPVVMERPGDAVVHVRFTVLLLPSGNTRITGLDYPTELFAPAADLTAVDADLAALLAQPDKKKKKKKAAAATA